jgi:hypothetical protein
MDCLPPRSARIHGEAIKILSHHMGSRMDGFIRLGELLDDRMIGFELKKNKDCFLIRKLLKKAFRIFLQDCFMLISLIRNHPTIQSSNHPWDASKYD